MDDKELKELLMAKQAGGNISCKAACEVAEATGESKIRIGELLDEMRIKIRACQLGCFE